MIPTVCLKRFPNINDEAFPPNRFFCCAKNKEKPTESCTHTFCHRYNKKSLLLFCVGRKIMCFICWYGCWKGMMEKNRNDYLWETNLPKNDDIFYFNRHCEDNHFHTAILRRFPHLKSPFAFRTKHKPYNFLCSTSVSTLSFHGKGDSSGFAFIFSFFSNSWIFFFTFRSVSHY
jgi:hypothetical protein